MLRGIGKQSGESVESGLTSLYQYHNSVIKQNSHLKNASASEVTTLWRYTNLLIIIIIIIYTG